MANECVLGISACLAGANVRYDGGHKLDRRLLELLELRAQLVPLCPEAEAGFGVPREPVDLYGSPEAPRMVGKKTGREATERIRRWARKALDGPCESMDGFVFRRKSPSCAVGSVPVYAETGEVISLRGVGLFARLFVRRYPFRPVAEGQELTTGPRVERFLGLLELGRGWRALVRDGGAVKAYHKKHRALLSALDTDMERALRDMASHERVGPAERRRGYGRLLASVLRRPALG